MTHRSQRRLALCLFAFLCLACDSEGSDAEVDLGAGQDAALDADAVIGDAAVEDASLAPDAASGAHPEGWTPETHEKGPPGYAQLFAEGEVQRIDLHIEADDWTGMQANMTELVGPFGEAAEPDLGLPEGALEASIEACAQLMNGGACELSVGGAELPGFCGLIPIFEDLLCLPTGIDFENTIVGKPSYFPVRIEYEGRAWHHAAIRYKGNSSLTEGWQEGRLKLGFRLHFDKYEDDHPQVHNQRFYGFKKMTFAPGAHDDSLIRDKLAAEFLRAQGLPVAHVAFYEVWADVGEGPVYWGLYSMIEDVADQFIEGAFEDDTGNLYKPNGSRWTEFKEASFIKKSNEEEADFSDIIAAIDALLADRSDAAAWRAALEEAFHVEGFLHWLALRQLLLNWDSYGGMPANYYLYGDPAAGGRLLWIPWDHNDVLLRTRAGDASFDFSATRENWPLIRFLYDDPEYRQAYQAHMRSALDGDYGAEAFTGRIDALFDLVAEPVSREAEPFTRLDGPHQTDTLKARFLEQRGLAEEYLSEQ